MAAECHSQKLFASSFSTRDFCGRKSIPMKFKCHSALRNQRTPIFNFFVLIFIAIVVVSCSKGSKDKPILLGKNDLLNITGSISIHALEDFGRPVARSDFKSTEVRLYNGTVCQHDEYQVAER